MMEKQDRYANLGGIEKAFNLYLSGQTTMTAISKMVNLSKTSVSNNFISRFGVDAVEAGRTRHWKESKKKKQHSDILAGECVELTYDEAMDCLLNKEIKHLGYLPLLETVVKISEKVTGKPERIWYSNFSLTRIDGNKGRVKIRYAKPTKSISEYEIDRYRFKITPPMFKNFDAGLFCIKNEKSVSYYLLPSKELSSIQSLNLKFDKHQNSKYAGFLVKVDYKQ